MKIKKPNMTKGDFFRIVNIVVAAGTLLTAIFVDEDKEMKRLIKEVIDEEEKNKNAEHEEA